MNLLSAVVDRQVASWPDKQDNAQSCQKHAGNAPTANFSRPEKADAAKVRIGTIPTVMEGTPAGKWDAIWSRRG